MRKHFRLLISRSFLTLNFLFNTNIDPILSRSESVLSVLFNLVLDHRVLSPQHNMHIEMIEPVQIKIVSFAMFKLHDLNKTTQCFTLYTKQEIYLKFDSCEVAS